MPDVDPNKVIRILAMKLADKEIQLAVAQAQIEQTAEDAAQAQSRTVNDGAQSTAGRTSDGT